jgi:hypothetical protein
VPVLILPACRDRRRSSLIKRTKRWLLSKTWDKVAVFPYKVVVQTEKQLMKELVTSVNLCAVSWASRNKELSFGVLQL